MRATHCCPPWIPVNHNRFVFVWILRSRRVLFQFKIPCLVSIWKFNTGYCFYLRKAAVPFPLALMTSNHCCLWWCILIILFFFFSNYKTVNLGWFQGAATNLIIEVFCNLKYASLKKKTVSPDITGTYIWDRGIYWNAFSLVSQKINICQHHLILRITYWSEK